MREKFEKIETTKMSSRGQIVIPENVRRAMSVKEGTIFAVFNDENILILEKIEMPSKERAIKKKEAMSERSSSHLSIKRIMEILKENKKEIKMYSVKKLGVFGSFLKGEQRVKSDIDVIVEFERTNFDNFMGLKLFLEKLFNRNIDLIVERTLKPEFKYVKREAKYVGY